MSSHVDAGAGTSLVRDAIPFSRFPWIRPLVHAYVTDFSSVASLFPGNPAVPDAWRAAVTRAQSHEAIGPSIAPVLAAQLRERDAPAAAREAADRLAHPGTVAVVTGQQAGLFGGPLYTLLKAVSTILVADHVRRTCHVDAVPVFWVDAEDHDWSEVRTAHVLDREFNVTGISLDDVANAGTHPVGRLVLDERVLGTIDQFFERVASTEYSAALRDSLRRHYQPGRTVSRAFAGLLDELVGAHGMVVFEADDARAKPLVAPLFAREISTPCSTAAHARAGAARMAALGHNPQIDPADDTVSLFYLDAEGRRSIRYRDGSYVVGDTSRDEASLCAEALSTPERFSPNVLLRPLVQDSLFPTVCYVGGPAELAYQVQLRDAYAAFGLETPLLGCRASATLLDSAAFKFLDKQQLPLEALQPQDESALNRLLESQLPPALEATFADLDVAVSGKAEQLKSIATSVDATLGGAVDTTVERMRDTLKSLQGKIVQAAKKKDETLRRQFIRTRALAFPAGHPQERHLNVAFFVNRCGPGLSDRLLEALPALPDKHLVIVP